MTPAELARIRRIVELRAAQVRIAAATHARDAAAVNEARAAETTAVAAVDDAADAASSNSPEGATAVDDLVEARLRVAFLSRLAAERARAAAVAEAKRRTSEARLQASSVTSEQMKSWFDGASRVLRTIEDRREDALRDELAARRAATKEPP